MKHLRLLFAITAVLALTACQGRVTGPTMTSMTAAPVGPGFARIYFYRDWEPYDSLSRPLIYLNDAPTRISEPGGISFSDVAPGEYHISVDSDGTYPHQFKGLVLRAGDIRYVKIESLRNWTRRGKAWERDTFVVELIPERQAQSEIADKRYIPGAS